MGGSGPGRPACKVTIVKLWTIQRPPAWDELRTTGILRATAKHVNPDFEDAYAWMRAQMVTRIGPPPEPDGYPVWAWYWYYGKRKPRPDLRYCGYLGKGDVGLRIEIECDPSDVLLSDFIDWHAVLNNRRLAASPSDDDAFSAEMQARGIDYSSRLVVPDVAARVRKSWELVFDLQRDVPEWKPPPDERYVQATMWEVRMDQVRDATLFVSR